LLERSRDIKLENMFFGEKKHFTCYSQSIDYIIQISMLLSNNQHWVFLEIIAK